MNTPLMFLCNYDKSQCIEIVRFLLDNKADVNATNNYGTTPLIYACRRGHIDIVRILIESGADYIICDKKGKSAIDHARKKHNTECVDYLNDLLVSKTEIAQVAEKSP